MVETGEGNIFAVGDIHGCYDNLITLMERLPFDRHRDTIVFLGDYINRGPKSRDVIDYLIELDERCHRAVFLLGNHEHALLQYSRTAFQDYFIMVRSMGIESTLKSYSTDDMRTLYDLKFMPKSHQMFMKRLVPLYRTDGYLFTHAGIINGEDPENSSLDRLLNVRETFLKSPPENEYTVVFGHTPLESPFVAPGKIGIDTGAVYGNMLTAVMLPEMVFFHG